MPGLSGAGASLGHERAHDNLLDPTDAAVVRALLRWHKPMGWQANRDRMRRGGAPRHSASSGWRTTGSIMSRDV